jgi:hypothetical protein
MNGQWTKFIPVVMVLLLLSCCSYSISEIRGYEPYRTFTSTKPPKEVAKCIELEIRAEKGMRFYEGPVGVALEEHPDQTYHVAITVPGYTAVADILVKPSGSGSLIEYRRKSWNAKQDRWFDYIEKCAR